MSLSGTEVAVVLLRGMAVALGRHSSMGNAWESGWLITPEEAAHPIAHGCHSLVLLYKM